MSFNLTNLFNIGVVSSILTLIVYHSFIYIGRRGSGKERFYYIYFCSFAANFLLYLLCVSSLQKFIFPSEEIRRLISPAVTGITFFLMLHFVIKTFKIIFELPSAKNRLLLPFYIPFVVYFILLSTYPFLDYDYYITNIFPYEAYISTIATLYMFIFFTIHFFSSKTLIKDRPSITVLFMFFIFMSDFFMEEMFTIMDILYPLKGTYFISGISVLIWAYALAIRFNNEHSELRLLKIGLEEKVKERTLQLQLANEQRASTFINLAHETRTPLTLIKNNLDDYYQKHEDNIEVEKIKYNIEKINQLIGNILNIDKYEKGHEIYNHDKTLDISAFITSKIDYFLPYASKKKIKIVSKIQKKTYYKIAPEALESLLDNLIANAIKFTEKGSITVSLFSNESSIVLSVKDTGIGIPINVQDKIFEPYFHFSKDYASGFGMGLAIVKNIVDSIDAKITFTSQPNEGTEFIITFKKSKNLEKDKVYEDYKISSSVIEPNITAVADQITHEKKPYVLIVEDNLELLSYLAEQLKENYNVYVATDGQKALTKIEESSIKPNLIVSDVMMDSMDGLEFYKLLKESTNKHIPLIYITAKTTSIDRDKALELGAIDYIYKPFEISEVKRKVDSIIDHSKNQRNVAIDKLKMFLESESNLESITAVKGQDNFDSNCGLFKISDREKEIILLANKDKTYNEIAKDLNISKKTVDTHFQNIFRKVGVKRQQELMKKLF